MMHGVIRSIVPHATCEVQVVEGVAFINFLDTNPKTGSSTKAKVLMSS